MELIPVQLQRFYFLHPMFWYVLFALSLVLITKELKRGKEISLIFLGLQLLVVFAFHGCIRFRDNPSFQDFIAKNTFEEINALIGEPKDSYRILSIGMHPSSSQINGFYTLDAYFPTYPITYKEKFRRIIAGELDRDPLIQKHFDEWGSHVYALSAERQVDFLNNHPPEIQQLAYDFEAFKEMGGRYLFCTTRINQQKNPALDFVGKAKGAYWEIFVYRVR